MRLGLSEEIAKVDLDEKIVDQRVGENVRRLRILRGLSQEKLAVSVGVTFQQIQKYEKGVNRISASRLVQFSMALACSLDELFAGAKEGGIVRDSEAFSMSKEATTVALRFEKISDAQIRRKVAVLISTLVDEEDA